MIEGAYAGLRVLDLGQGVAAPYDAMLLTMHGAEAVKLEPAAIGRAASVTTPRCRRSSIAARKA
jgi:crotonobetainyl-CoA:carnitine CoA-transferase CaiB-like acyl-CoA transferase